MEGQLDSRVEGCIEYGAHLIVGRKWRAMLDVSVGHRTKRIMGKRQRTGRTPRSGGIFLRPRDSRSVLEGGRPLPFSPWFVWCRTRFCPLFFEREWPKRQRTGR